MAAGTAGEWPTYFETDLTDMLRADAGLLQTFIEGTETPPDTVHRTNLPRNPLHQAYAWYGAMQRVGYGIHFVASAEQNGRPAPHHVALRIDSADEASVRSIEGLTRSGQAAPQGGHLPYGQFLNTITSGRMAARQLDLGYVTTRKKLLPDLENNPARNLLQRGFLLSCLTFGVANKKLGLRGVRPIPPENERLYEIIRSRDTKPLSAEEVQGLGAYAVRHILKLNPDIAPPHKQSTDTTS